MKWLLTIVIALHIIAYGWWDVIKQYTSCQPYYISVYLWVLVLSKMNGCKLSIGISSYLLFIEIFSKPMQWNGWDIAGLIFAIINVYYKEIKNYGHTKISDKKQ